jgi:hypothetical protein
MPSISHRTGLGQEALRRAKSGLAALPAGIMRGVIRGFQVWLEIRREVRQLEDHVVHDVGFQVPARARPGAGHSDADVRSHASWIRPMPKRALIEMPAGPLRVVGLMELDRHASVLTPHHHRQPNKEL